MYTINSFQHNTTEGLNISMVTSGNCVYHLHTFQIPFLVVAAPQEGKNQASVLKLKVLFKGLTDLIKTKFG